jgi:hypothetical protein
MPITFVDFPRRVCGSLHSQQSVARRPRHPQRQLHRTSLLAAAPPSRLPPIDSVVRFHSETSVDSSLREGEIRGRLVSASTGAPVQFGRVWMTYPNHRHTTRQIIADTEGHFLIAGLPDETGTSRLCSQNRRG